MGLSVEHPGVLSIGTRDLELGILICVDQVRVLEHFGEEEGLLEVGEVAAVGCVDVGDRAVATADAGVLGDGLEAGEGPLEWKYQCHVHLCEKRSAFRGIENIRLGTCDRQWRDTRSKTIPAPQGEECSSCL